MLLHWIWLATRPNLSDRVKANLLQHFHDAEDIFYADPELYRVVEGMSPAAAESLQDKNLAQAEQIQAECARKNIHILTYRDAAYPCRLRNIADPPMVLYYKGTLPDFDNLPLIAVVGTRRATSYGLTAAKRIGYQLAACGGTVVSGLATGIDTVAMRSALSAGSNVIGVLGCGVDVVYPASNRGLYADVEQKGCLLSEYAPGTEPFKWNFPRRNRIISGLSCGVLVIEAPEKSGALITARQAFEQGREVFAVPGNIDMPTCAGSNALLRDGAIMAVSGWDVLSEYEARFSGKLCNRCGSGRQIAYPDEVERLAAEAEKPLPKVAQKPSVFGGRKKKIKKEIDSGASSHYIDAEKKHPSMTADEQRILELVQQGMTHADDLVERTELPAGVVLAALTTLEIKGVLQRLPGKRVRLK